MTPYADKLPRPKSTPRPQPHADMRDNLKEKPIVICPLKQGWLVGWFEIGSYCGFARGKGTGAARTGRVHGRKNTGCPCTDCPTAAPVASHTNSTNGYWHSAKD
jgi:hypothetical protein